MIYLLFAVLVATTVTGLLVVGGEEKQGPFAGIATYSVGNGAKEIHEALVIVLLVLVAGHIAGVIAHGFLTGENLITAMITGDKILPPGTPLPNPRPARPGPAAVTVAAIIGVAALALIALSRLPPTTGRQLALDPAYADECGACHDPFHPSLLPAASWAALMAGLQDHFGEDASLDPARAEEIAAWLDDQRRRDVGHRGRQPLPRCRPGAAAAHHREPLLAAQARRDPRGRVRAQGRGQQGQLLGLPPRRGDRALRRSGHRHSQGGASMSRSALPAILIGCRRSCRWRRGRAAGGAGPDPGRLPGSGEAGRPRLRRLRRGARGQPCSAPGTPAATPRPRPARAATARIPGAPARTPRPASRSSRWRSRPTRSATPNQADVEKWFKRNCKQVLGRECTPAEKGDFITFMMSQ